MLVAAEALFAEQGFDAASMSAIAERAGVSKANVFHHFSSKNALYLAVLREACKESRAKLEQLESGSGSYAERVCEYAAGHLASILGHDDIARLILRDLLDNGTVRGKELAEQVFGQNFARLVKLIEDGQACGELRAGLDPAAVAVMLISSNVYFFLARDVLRHLPQVDFAEDPQGYGARVMQLMLRGLLPTSQEK